MTESINRCPLCDSSRIEVRYDRKARYRYLKNEHVLEGQEHTVCLECGTSYYQDGQIERNNERLLKFSEGIVKHIAPWQIREVREKYMLTQADAARIFCCGPRAFSKWERGEVAPTGATAKLLRMALKSPEVMLAAAMDAGVKLDGVIDSIASNVAHEVMAVVEGRIKAVYEAGHKDGHKKGHAEGHEAGRRAGLVQKVNLVLSEQRTRPGVLDYVDDDEGGDFSEDIPWQEKRSFQISDRS